MESGLWVFRNVDGRGQRSIAVRERRECTVAVAVRSDGAGESLVLLDLLPIEVGVLVVVAAAGMGDEVERPLIEVRGEGVVAQFSVDHGGALEAIDGVGELGEESGTDGEGIVEASRVGEVDGRVGQRIEAVVVVVGQPSREGLRDVGERGRAGDSSLLRGAGFVSG